ncbi:hypothetical protein MF6396_03230 [Pseudomonas sp. MF6396]|uniref:DNA translocase FtsK n=1 Tax=Pseudomonas sp. MF6396 TaxID=1960828 RepID=UPI000996717D|nr:DNA translocase FtsK [Pseudomonas sp. MF6396]OOW06674.1 hypothetical protein MF6396_03230 [Pseudomonas sp. MF6396]
MNWLKRIFSPKGADNFIDQPVKISDIGDDLYPKAVDLVIRNKTASVSLVQRELKIGFARASRFIEAMENDRIVSSIGPEGHRHIISPDQRSETAQQPPAVPVKRPAADSAFDREHYFLPFPSLTTPHSDLVLVGTKCYLGDKTYEELLARHGRWVPSTKEGKISDVFTHTDIGQLDLAINDYINFLIRIRSVAESDIPVNSKIEMIRAISELTGPEGHSHSEFVRAHGGLSHVIEKLIG